MKRSPIIREQSSIVKSKTIPPPLSLDTPVRFLKGIGPQRSTLFKRLGLNILRDLIYHLPRRHEDRRAFLSIAQLIPGQKATMRGAIAGTSVFRAKTGTVILQVTVKDSTGSLVALWFNQPYMRRWFPTGQEIILYGTADRVGRRLQMVVPEFELIREEKGGQSPSGTVPRSLHMGRIVPIYPATSGLHQRELREAVAAALKGLLPILALTDPIPPALRERHSLLDLATALKRVHFPPTPETIEPAKARLAFEELFYFQLALGIRRRALQQRKGIAHQVQGDLFERWKQSLPFQLTAGQETAIQEIFQDMAAPRPMHRLVQGEVGSGKTAVAAAAAVAAVQSGFQAVVMAPTEVLARQHALTLTQLLSPVDLQVALLTGSLEESDRQRLRQELVEGSVQVLVGTHALLEPWVNFKKLGLVVIDEQQKFGVDQRNGIVAKGNHPDLLILTATPIPRTLALTLYGEMEVSTIIERPTGRQAVQTILLDSTRREEVYAFVRKELDAGRQGYVVCPRIGGDRHCERGGDDVAGLAKQSPREIASVAPEFPFVGVEEGLPRNDDIRSATALFEEYKRIFSGYRVALLHGQISREEQKAVFAAFKRGDIQLLVATQIIEVGVDVSNATVMVIEGADRFGLAQLHQLRGRVGRGKQEATCILLADPKDPATLERLQTVVGTTDAFKIAEEDLRLRGPGELLGKRQAGLPDLKCLQWALQGPWLETARSEAEDFLTNDPAFSSAGSAPLRREIRLRFPKLISKCA